MTMLSIPRALEKILIVGSFHGKTDKLLRAQTLIPNYDLTVFIGGMYYSFQDLEEVDRNLDIMQKCIATGKASYCLSPYDEMLIQGLLIDTTHRVCAFFEQSPNVIETGFANGNKILILNGGVIPKTTRKKLEHDTEITFVNNFDKKPWHESYDGRFGYVVSNNPQTLQEPQFYKFSCQLGNERDEKAQVYAQEADQFGLKRTILL